MDQTDFAIAMVSGVLIIISIFLFILVRIFEKKKKAKPIDTVLPDLNKIEPHEFQPEKFGIRPYEIEGLEKEFRLARDLKKKESIIDIMGEKKKTQIPKGVKEEPLNEIKEDPLKGTTEPIKEILLSEPLLQSIEENEKLKLEDILIETRDENIQKKAKKKGSSSKNLEKADKLKQVSKVSEEKSPRKKPGIKVRKTKKSKQ